MSEGYSEINVGFIDDLALECFDLINKAEHVA